MAKVRSPQYPAIGLGEAIKKIAAVYGKEHQAPTDRGVIAAHMGYNSLNGKSLGVLSALGKYGLLEGRGAEYRVSDLGLKIIAHQPGDPERVAAIREAASKPELFAELEKRGKSSPQAIRSYLLMQKFLPAAADTAIRAYRETNQVVEAEEKGYDSTSEEEAFEALTGVAIGNAEEIRKHMPLRNRPPPPPPGNEGKVRIMEGERELTTGLLSKESSFRLIVRGKVGVREIERLIRKLELDKEILAESEDPEGESANG
jgi:hypothetical protein